MKNKRPERQSDKQERQQQQKYIVAAATQSDGNDDSENSSAMEDEDDQLESEDMEFQKRLEEMKEFKESEGHCRVPPQNYGELRKWVETQRESKKSGTMT